MLAELVELVIGVDTHADTHTAAVVATDTRAILATTTLPESALQQVLTDCNRIFDLVAGPWLTITVVRQAPAQRRRSTTHAFA
jgi:hypothetical protein